MNIFNINEMKSYKILVPKVLLKNNSIAEYGDLVDGEKFTATADELVKGGYIEEVESEQNAHDSVGDVEQPQVNAPAVEVSIPTTEVVENEVAPEPQDEQPQVNALDPTKILNKGKK